MKQFERTINLIGEQKLRKLQDSHVAIFGIGGVGSYVCEALARAGVGAITVVDSDTIAETNINRQLYALHSTIGQNKVDVAKQRILDINPNCVVTPLCLRFDKDTISNFDFNSYNYVADCIDTVTSKLLLVELCNGSNTPIISCMGTGNKLDASKLQVANITQTSVCPLARVMRTELKKRNVDKLKVVFSTELPLTKGQTDKQTNKPVPTSISYVPSVAGLLIAGEIIQDLIA